MKKNGLLLVLYFTASPDNSRTTTAGGGGSGLRSDSERLRTRSNTRSNTGGTRNQCMRTVETSTL